MIEVSQIMRTIQSAIPEADVQIANPSHDGLHFDAIVISSFFKGKSLIEQHQMVMSALKKLFDSNLHALSLKTYTPEEWEEIKNE